MFVFFYFFLFRFFFVISLLPSLTRLHPDNLLHLGTLTYDTEEVVLLWYYRDLTGRASQT